MPPRMRQTGRRPDIENDLTEKYHVGWEYMENVPASAFDIDLSLKNQARFEAVHEETVAEYVDAMERGDLFPAVIASRRRKGGKLVIVDGNHRLVAADRSGSALSVYEVETGTRQSLVQAMTYAFNTRHGRPTSEEERAQQALYMIDNGMTVEDAAGFVNLSKSRVQRELNKRNASQRAAAANIDMREWEVLTQGARSRLLHVSTDEGMKDAAHLCYVAGLNSTEVAELVTTINATGRSATKQRAFIRAKTAEYTDRIQAGMGGGANRNNAPRKGTTPKARVAMIMGNLMALPEPDVLAGAWGSGEAGEVIEQLDGSIDRLTRLRKALADR